MIIFHEAGAIRKWLAAQQTAGRSVGFVPTMGALHPGHLSLITLSRQAASLTVCSIFVNPTQFNDPADFEKYPVTTANDIRMLESAGCDVLFLPATTEIYPNGTAPDRHYDLGYLETVFEGTHRPGHFQGVCQVVHRLLDIVQPAQLFLGQKDYQQCMVLTRLVEMLSLPTMVVIGPTLRETSGLAMSSRNQRLDIHQLEQATIIYKTLLKTRDLIHQQSVAALEERAASALLQHGFQSVDYFSLANAKTLEPFPPAYVCTPADNVVALVAAFIGGVRLIDNMVMN